MWFGGTYRTRRNPSFVTDRFLGTVKQQCSLLKHGGEVAGLCTSSSTSTTEIIVLRRTVKRHLAARGERGTWC